MSKIKKALQFIADGLIDTASITLGANAFILGLNAVQENFRIGNDQFQFGAGIVFMALGAASMASLSLRQKKKAHLKGFKDGVEIALQAKEIKVTNMTVAKLDEAQ
jgi:hypothetical protein